MEIIMWRQLVLFVLFVVASCISQAKASEPRLAEPMEIAALGRSFSLGTLYDVRTEHLSPLNLWNQGTIEKGKLSKPQPFTDFKFRAVNSFDQKADFMDIEGNVKMSFLSGLVEVEGSAKYLTEKKTLANSASVSMVMQRRSKVESLTQEFFSNVEYEDYLIRKEFTHVVTKIVYGADAYFKFSRVLEEEESKKDIEGELAADIAGIFSFSAKVDLTSSEKNKLESISVDFNGDFDNIVPPKNYLEAADVVTKISTEKTMVPMKVTLTPLHVLNDQVTTLLREINHETIRRAGELRSAFDLIEEQLNEELSGQAVKYFPKLKDNLNHVKRMFERKSGTFTSQLRTLLPQIRNNTISEQALIDILNEAEDGIYHKSYFDTWLGERKKYANTLGRQLTIHASSDEVKFLPTKHDLVNFQLKNDASYYTLEGSLRGIDESFYIKAINQNDTSIIENAPKDQHSWVNKYRRPVIRILSRFEKLGQLRNYNRIFFNDISNQKLKPIALGFRGNSTRKNVPEKIGLPKRAIFIDMPGNENKLNIKTYYGGVEIKLKPLEELGFEDGNDHLVYKKQTIEDIEIVEYDDSYDYGYDDYDPDVDILGYEIRLRKFNKKIYSYVVNILKKSSLTPGQKYLINARVILEGGVRGPWNKKDTEYTRPFQAVDGKWSQWEAVGACSSSCGLGLETQKRLCESPAPTNGGKQCTKDDGHDGLMEEKKFPCKIKDCPVDCSVSEWAAWGSCSASCSGGVKSTTRRVTRQPLHGGNKCPVLTTTQQCNTHSCPVDCLVSEWAAWGSCSASCSRGVKSTSRKVTRKPLHGGKRCPVLTTTQKCYTCPGFTLYATCDNKMKLYADGKLLATSNDWETTTEVNIPINTKVIEINCLDLGVVGGILAHSWNGIKTDGRWSCSNGKSWKPAYQIGPNGMKPWGIRPHISTDAAKWIWTAGWKGTDKHVQCKIDMSKI